MGGNRPSQITPPMQNADRDQHDIFCEQSQMILLAVTALIDLNVSMPLLNWSAVTRTTYQPKQMFLVSGDSGVSGVSGVCKSH